MIFLFNTSSGSNYMENVFATLHFPYGMINQYQYNCSVVDNVLIQTNCIGQEVLISHVDKAANTSPVYLPLRKGELVKVEQKDGRVCFDVRLLEYCNAINDKGYSDFIKNSFNGIVYHKENNGTFNGILAIQKDIDASLLIEATDNSWIETVEKLSKKKAFLDCYSIFTKIYIVDENGKELEIEKKGREYGYLLKSDKKYDIVISYYMHEYNKSQMMKIHAAMEDSQNICGLIWKELDMGGKHSISRLPLQIKTVDKMQTTSIGIKCKEDVIENKKVVYTRKGLKIFVESKINPKLKVFLIGLCVFALGVSTWISTLPIESIIVDTEEAIALKEQIGSFQGVIYDFSRLLNKCKYFYNAICSAISAISTFGLVRLYGKPKL